MARTAKRQITPGAVAYIRVSTEEQASSGLGLAAQRAAIESECQRRGLPIVAIYTDAGVSGKALDRPGLRAALADLDAGRGSVLVVSKLDRLSRSVHDASGLMLRAERGGWGLVALDVAVDTTTPSGAAMTQILSVFAELERRLIGQRTRDALAAKRARGARLGRPQALPDTVVTRIIREHAEGCSLVAIAAGLEADAVPTARGGARWYPSTVQAVLRSQRAAELVK